MLWEQLFTTKYSEYFSPLINISQVSVYKTSKINWECLVLDDASLDFFIDISLDNGETWMGWQKVQQGQELLLAPSTNLFSAFVRYMARLQPSSRGFLPELKSVTLTIETQTTISDGPIIKECVFNYIPVSDAFDSLAEKAGLYWFIDHNKILYFNERNFINSPWQLTSSDIVGEPEVRNDNSKYRNIQYVKGGKDITDEQEERLSTNGITRSWPVGFPLAKVPRIFINGVQLPASDVGIKGLSENKKFYWSKGDNIIMQSELEPALDSSVDLRVKYQGEFSVISKSANFLAIENMQAIEGDGTGLVEDVADEPTLNSREAAFESANKKLEKFSSFGNILKFRTLKYGLKVGQRIQIMLPEYDLFNVEMIIQSIEVKLLAKEPIYTVTATDGPITGSWAKAFKQMSSGGLVVRENISEDEVLVTLESFNKIWYEEDQPNIFKTELYPSNSLYPSSQLYPRFSKGSRITQVVLERADNSEILRKEVTKQTEITEGLKTTLYVNATEANEEQIAYISWWGGDTASEYIPKSGTLIDRQPYSKYKTQLEALQIDRIDTKGW